jgi:PDZ domain-containing protein
MVKVMKKLTESILNFIKDNFVFLLLIILIIGITFVKIPYQVEMPGGIIDLENRVEVNGEGNEIEGSFNMAYVSVIYGSIPHVLLGLVLPDWDVLPNTDTMYDNETMEDANTRGKLYLEQSKDYAIASAMTTAGIPYEIENKVNHVAYIDEKANTSLKIGDNILTANGDEIYDLNEFKSFILEQEVGSTVKFEVERNGEIVEAEAKVYEDDGENFVGIAVLTTFDVISDMSVSIETKSSESGPSGGMMMALMVYSAITKQDLTHGKKVVGTGTIDVEGNVGDIGGVKFKLMGAVNSHADIFLVPEENYEEAIKVKKEKGYKIDVVSVKTLKDAIDYLEALDD